MSHVEDHPQLDMPRSVSGLDAEGTRVWRPVDFTFSGSEWRDDDTYFAQTRKASWRRWLLLSVLSIGLATAVAMRDHDALPTLGSALQPLALVQSGPLQPLSTVELAPAPAAGLSLSPVVAATVPDLDLPAIALPTAPPIELMSHAAGNDQQVRTITVVNAPVVPTFPMPPTPAAVPASVEALSLGETVQPQSALADTQLPVVQSNVPEGPPKAARPEDGMATPTPPAPITSDRQRVDSLTKVEPAKSRSAVTAASQTTRKEKRTAETSAPRKQSPAPSPETKVQGDRVRSFFFEHGS